MSIEDLERLAADMRVHLGLKVEFLPDPDPTGLRVNQVDLFFYADGSGYDGWGRHVAPPRVHP